MTTFTVVLTGGSPWGFRLQGGREFNEPVKIAKINPNSKAFYEGLQVDDTIVAINGQQIHGLNHNEVQALIKNATTGALTLLLQRDTHTVNGHVNGAPPHPKGTPGPGSSFGSTDSLPGANMNGHSTGSSGMAAWSPPAGHDNNNNTHTIFNSYPSPSSHHGSQSSSGHSFSSDPTRGSPCFSTASLPPLSLSHHYQGQHYQDHHYPGYHQRSHHYRGHHRHPPHQIELTLYPHSTSPFSSSSSFSSFSPVSFRRALSDVNQWQTSQRQNVSPSSHAPNPHTPQVGHKPETPLAQPHSALTQPPPLPVQLPTPYLRPIIPPSQIPSTNYKPYPSQPPPPAHLPPQLSPKLKHKLASPPQAPRQQQPQRRIIQHSAQPMSPPSYTQPIPMKEFVQLLQEDLKSPPSDQPSIQQQYEDYQRRKGQENKQNTPMQQHKPMQSQHPQQQPTQQHHGHAIKQPHPQQQPHQHPQQHPPQHPQQQPQHPPRQQPSQHQPRQQPPQQPHQPRQQPHQPPQQPPPQPPPQPPHHLQQQQLSHQQQQQQPPHHQQQQPHYQPHPNSYLQQVQQFNSHQQQQHPQGHAAQRPQHFEGHSPSDHPSFREPPSPTRSNIYRPTAISDIFHRGSPTPSLPGDFLRQKQASPTPSVTSTSSEYVVSGGRGRANKSRGLNLFLKQQERLAAMGADVQDVHPVEGQVTQPPPEFGQQYTRRGSAGVPERALAVSAGSKSLQGSPTVHEKHFPPPWQAGHTHPGQTTQDGHVGKGAKPWSSPARSISVDTGSRRIPIPVHHAEPSKPVPSNSIAQHPAPSNSIAQHPAPSNSVTPQRTRRFSQEDSTSSTGPGPAKLSSSWQTTPGSYFPYDQNKGREFIPGTYATLPTKGSKHRGQHEFFEQEPPRSDFDLSNTYSTLPTIKPLKSSLTHQSFSEHRADDNPQLKSSQSYDFGRRDLEHTLDYKDYSKPLWANTDLDSLQHSSISSQDDGHSPHSDNAVSSSDSRDTIIAKDEKSSAESLPLDIHQDMKSQDKPALPAKPFKTPGKMIPIPVVHEQPSKPAPSIKSPTATSSFFSPGFQDDQSSSPLTKTSQPYPYSDKTNDYRPNGSISDEFRSLGYPQKSDSWESQTLPLRSSTDHQRSSTDNQESLKNIAPVWKPGGTSTLGIKKEYRPVRLDTTKKPQKQNTTAQGPPPEETFAWKPPRTESTNSLSSYSPLDTSSSFKQTSNFEPTDSRHMNGDSGGDETRLPPTQSPYITLLQKSRDTEETPDFNGMKFVGKPIIVNDDGQLPKGAQYIGSKHISDGDKSTVETYYTTPSEQPTSTTKVVTEVKPVKYDGIGPVDKEGVPLGFRKNVDEEKQKDWYKQMYRSLHKTEKKEDHLGINAMIDSIFEDAVKQLETNSYRPTYQFPDDISDTKSEEGLDEKPYRPSYGKTKSKVDESGYRSEPEGRYKDLMKHRSKSTSESREPRRNPWAPSNVRSKIEVYRCQPRSIMDYEPGFSSIAFREQRSPHNPRIDKPGDFSQYSENYKGTASERASSYDETDNIPASDKYKKIVHGGEIPIRGLQKPAPEKTKKNDQQQPPGLPPPPSGSSTQAYAISSHLSASQPSLKSPLKSPSTLDRKTDKGLIGGQSSPKEKSTYSSSSAQQSAPTSNSSWSNNTSQKFPRASASKDNLRISSSGQNKENQFSRYASTPSLVDSKQNLSPPLTYAGAKGLIGSYENLYGGTRSSDQTQVPSPPKRQTRANGTSMLESWRQPSRASAAEQLGVKSPPPSSAPKDFRHQTSDVIRKSLPVDEKEKKRKEEDEAYRKKRLEELYEEERKKRVQLDAEKESARRHHDFFTPSQKSPISPNRFEEVPDQRRQTLSPAQQRSPNVQTSKLTTTLSVPPERRRGFQIQGKAKALYNFTAQNPRELSFRKGDVLYLLRQIDKNWFEGEHHGQAGIFPANYVEVITSIEAARVAALDAEGQGRAKYNFTGQSSVELSLRKGEFVTLLRRVDDNWLEGKVGGRQGIFPLSYVEIIREPSTPLITPAPSVITTPMTGTPEMLSPVSIEAPTPPPQPSPSAFSLRSPGMQATYGYKPQPAINRFQYDSQSPADLKSPHEFTVYGQKGVLSPPSSRRGPQDRPRPSDTSAVFPSVNLDISTSSSAMGKPRANKVADDDLTLQRHRAIYAYRPQSEDELELKEGDEVFVMEKCDDGWFVGTSARTGNFGTFPGNYVQKY